MKANWTCPKCEKMTEVTVWPLVPAKISGPPENCYPEEGGEHEPTECEHCETEIPNDAVYEQAAGKARDDWETRAESLTEAREEFRREEKEIVARENFLD